MKNENEVLSNDSVYDDVAGVGFENMDGGKFTMSMLLIAQATSEVVSGKINGIQAGDYYNSITKENYGPNIELIIAYFEAVWQIWKPNLGGFVGRVRPNSIRVTGDVYKGMVDESGNDVIDTWLYFVLIKGKEDQGILVMPVTSNGIKFAKILNGMIHDSRMLSGKRAPIFYRYWKLGSGGTKFEKGYSYSFGKDSTPLITGGEMVPPNIYLEHVKESVSIAPAAVYGSATVCIDPPPEQLAIADSGNEKY